MENLINAQGYYSYPFDLSQKEQGWAIWQNGFSEEDIQKIHELGKSFSINEAKVGGSVENPEVNTNIRNSQISWIPPQENTIWLFQKICEITTRLNDNYFGFELNGVLSLQYTIYDSNINGTAYYDWHIDRMGRENAETLSVPRKLSFVLQLSDPFEYEGGELWIQGLKTNVAPKTKGLVIAFPSYTSHRVTPITKGIRKSLVAWIVGPDFR
jgi:PKHD-type hydroxylase